MTESQQDRTPAYGSPASKQVILSQGFDQACGLEYEALLLPDTYKPNIAARRRRPTVAASDFFSSLVEADGRYFFSGVLNGWPALTTLELLELRDGKKLLWASASGKRGGKFIGKPPQFPGGKDQVVAKLRAPDYTRNGYTKSNPGHIYWVDASQDGLAKTCYFGKEGVELAKESESREGKAVRVHMFGHRYAKKKESLKDTVSYHTGVLVEWDHQQFSTVIELAWLNGIGGYSGNSNYIYDSFQGEENSLYRVMHAGMKAPWHEKRSELRMFDMPWKGVADFVSFFNAHKGKGGRFIDPKIRFSDEIRLENPTRENIYASLLSYVSKDGSYSEWTSWRQVGNNCQSFAANIQGFLTQKNAKPFTRVIAPLYNKRTDLFESELEDDG